MHVQPRTRTRVLKNLRLAIVRTSWYEELVDRLEGDARGAFVEAGLKEEHIETFRVPGCFEIPLGCSTLLKRKRKPDGILALGLVIEGETHHARLITDSCTQGIQLLQLQYGIPIAHGVLFVKNREQAASRASGKKARGKELAKALLAMIHLLRGGPSTSSGSIPDCTGIDN